MLAIVFLPQIAPKTALPGSKGSLMVLAGGLAAVAMVLALLTALDVVFAGMNFRDIFFLIAVAGGLLMGWAGWQEFQSEGGKFQVGTAGSAAPASGAAAEASAPPPAPAPASEPMASPEPEAAPTADASVDAVDDEDRPTA
jgi:hypothetical protein